MRNDDMSSIVMSSAGRNHRGEGTANDALKHDRRADPNGLSGRFPSTSPLHEAATAPTAEPVRALLSAGAQINLCDGAQNTPLHACCAAGADADVVRALLEARADVGARNADGATPLHLAARASAKEGVRALVGAGADPLLSDHQGRDALGYSRAEAMDQLLQQLIRATTDPTDGCLLPGAAERLAPPEPPSEALRQALVARLLPDGLDAEQAARVAAALASMDVDASGGVSRKELRRALEAVGARMSSREAAELFSAGDADADGVLDAAELAALAPRLKPLLRALLRKAARTAPASPAARPAARGGARTPPGRGATARASGGRAPEARPASARARPERGAGRRGASPRAPAPAAARAKTPPPAGADGVREEELRALFAAHDSDGSGTLSLGEALAALGAHGADASSDAVLSAARQIRTSDANADGRLDLREFAKLRAAVEAARRPAQARAQAPAQPSDARAPTSASKPALALAPASPVAQPPQRELGELRASHEALLRSHAALQAEVRRARQPHGQGAGAAAPEARPAQPVAAGVARAQGRQAAADEPGKEAEMPGSDWRAQPLPALRRTVDALDRARHDWRGARSPLEEAHGAASAAYRQLELNNSARRGARLAAPDLPSDVRAAVRQRVVASSLLS